MPLSMRGFSLDQVVEVMVPGGEVGYGSGYYLGGALVITASHVVDQARPILVRFGTRPVGEPIPARVVWSGQGHVDLAFLELEMSDTPDVSTELEWGFVAPIDPAGMPVTFRALGFPRSRAGLGLDGHPFRDTLPITGTVRPGGYRKTGRLDLVVTDRAMDNQHDWKGMSGAAVFVHDFLVGVVVRAAPSGNELIAVPVAAALGDHPVRIAEFTSGAEERQGAHDVLLRSGLSSNVAPARRRPYLDTVAELDAQCPVLRGRAQELRRLRQWLGSPKPYAMWSGTPWSGKTALAARLAAEPPAGVDVVAFFVSSARGAQAGHLWQVVADQLAALVNEPAPADGKLAFDQLWQRASQASETTGRKLLLLIDGVDDLQERHAVTELLTRLPRRSLHSAHVLLFTRPNPRLEQAVAADHPLRGEQCDRIDLDPSPDALGLRDRAQLDLETVLDDGGAALRALLLIARIGPMSESDIRQAIGWQDAAADHGALHRALTTGPSGRMLRHDAVRTDRPRFMLAHDTLRDELLERVAPETAEADIGRLLALADDYTSRGWPDDTPDFLLEGYPSLLAQRGDTPRLTATVLSSRWLDLARRRMHTVLTAVTALREALITMSANPSAELAALLLLAAHLADLDPPRMASFEPPRSYHGKGLVTAWSLAGELEYAEHIAICLPDSDERAATLARLASQVLERNDRDWANRLLDRALESATSAQVGTLLRLQRLALQLGRVAPGAEVSATIWALLPLLPRDEHVELWLGAAENAASDGDVEHVRAAAAVLGAQTLASEDIHRLAVAARTAGDGDLADHLENLAAGTGLRGSAETTHELAEDEPEPRPSQAASHRPANQSLERIRSLIGQGDYSDAANFIDQYEEQPQNMLEALERDIGSIISVAIQAATDGGPAAVPVVAAAQRYVRRKDLGAELKWNARVGSGSWTASSPIGEPAGTFLAEIIEVAARHGQLGDLLNLTTINNDLSARIGEFSAFAVGAARAGYADTAALLLAAIRPHADGSEFIACCQVAQCWAETERWRDAIDLVRDYRHTFEPSLVRATAVMTAIGRGDLPDGVSALIQCADNLSLAFSLDDLLAKAAVQAMQAGHEPLFLSLFGNIESPQRRVELQAEIAVAAHENEDFAGADMLMEIAYADAAALAEPADHCAALVACAGAALERGQSARARKIVFHAAKILGVLSPADQVGSLLQLAEVAHEAGDPDLCAGLVRKAASAARLIQEEEHRTRKLQDVVLAAYRAGQTELAAGLANPDIITASTSTAKLVAAAAEAGDSSAAARLLQAMGAAQPQSLFPGIDPRPKYLSLIAVTAARAKLWSMAEEALAALEPDDRIDTLAELADIGLSDEPRRAREWVIQGFLLGISPRLLSVAAHLEPALAVQAATVLLAQSRAFLPPSPASN